MIKVMWFYSVCFYGGFVSSREECCSFSSLAECFKSYKKSKKYDFAYDDGTYHITTTPCCCFVFEKNTESNKHGMVVGHKPSVEEQYRFYGKEVANLQGFEEVDSDYFSEKEYVFDSFDFDSEEIMI